MHIPRSIRFLSLPVALGLGTAFLMACSEDAPTAPDSAAAASAPEVMAKKKGNAGNKPSYQDDVDGTCPALFTLVAENGHTSMYDTNGNGFVCRS